MNTEYFLSINEVSKRLDLPAYTLRYWEKQFPTRIKPATGAGGRRYYRPETVNALGAIKELLYSRGMTIAGVKKMIKSGEFDSPEPGIGNHEPATQSLGEARSKHKSKDGTLSFPNNRQSSKTLDTRGGGYDDMGAWAESFSIPGHSLGQITTSSGVSAIAGTGQESKKHITGLFSSSDDIKSAIDLLERAKKALDS